jgi:LemA protein
MAFMLWFFLIVFGPVVFAVFIYNALQRKRVNVEERWSSIGALLQKRNDLIPSLVETVRGYAGHEKTTFAEVTKMRTSHNSQLSPAEYSGNEPAIRQAIANINAVAEQYPNLKADQNFASLQQQLTVIENEISGQRLSYNNSVRILNEALVVFPNNLIASTFKIEKGQFFMEQGQSNLPPQVKF